MLQNGENEIMGIFQKALLFAADKHEGQYRKGNRLPYILHPMEVAAILSSLTTDEEILAAGVLHDTVEDAGVTPEELRRIFGDRVADLVASETEDKHGGGSAEQTWRRRKETSLRVLRESEDLAVRMLWLGDKLSNMRSFARQYRKEGDAMWQHYHEKDPATQAWYYRTVEKELAVLAEYDAYDEYVQLTNEIFASVPRTTESNE